MAVREIFEATWCSQTDRVTDNDLMIFAKKLYKEGIITAETVYDEENDRNVVVYHINVMTIRKN